MGFLDRISAAGRALVGPGPAPDLEPALALGKAQKAVQEVAGDPPEGPPESLLWDPYTIIEQLGFREKSTAVTLAISPIAAPTM